MLCELCHKDEAAGTLHRKDANGEDEELYVCKRCLARHGGATGNGADGGTDSGADDSSAKNGPKIITPDGEEPPAFIRNFLDAAVGLIEGVAKSEAHEERKCPVCYGPRHLGKIPEKTPDGKPSRAFLEKELRDAVARQNYRKAARIRKQLDEMGGESK